MDLESIYIVLYGASGCDRGAHYSVIKKWFTQCGIIDGSVITEGLFIRSYQRLCPNLEPLTLVQFAQMIGILARETKQEVSAFAGHFQTVRQIIIDEIQENRFLIGGGMLFQHFVAEYRKLPLKAAEECARVTSCIEHCRDVRGFPASLHDNLSNR